MKHHLYRVVENKTLWRDAQLLAFDAPELAAHIRPGQFALARDPTTFDPYLRRALWLYHVEGERVEFTIHAHDPLVSRARVGATIDLLAPLGNAAKWQARARRILLVGEAERIAMLICYAWDAIARQREVVLTVSGDAFPAHLLPPEVEYRIDGLNAELIGWADAIVACGSDDFIHSLADQVRAARDRIEKGFVNVLIDRAMPCGTGLCYACAIETFRGIQLSCIHGPVFDLADLEAKRKS